MTHTPEQVIVEDAADEDAADAAAILANQRPELVRGWLVPAIIGSALFLQTLNSNSINNALPSMARSMHLDPLRLSLAITVYLLAMAIFLPISGWMADRFGAKRILMLAMAVFAASSAACGLANGLVELVAFRFIQGCAGAMMSPVGRLVLLRTTPKDELVGALSVVTIPSLVGPVVGPLLGGAIITYASWRWIFLLNLPVAIAGIFLVRAFVPNVKEQAPPRLDLLGIVLTGFGLAGIIFGFENLGRNVFPQTVVAASFAVGLAVLAAFWAHARRTPHAVIDLAAFRIPTFQASVVGGAFYRLTSGSTPFLLAMLLQESFGMTALAAGMMTFISAVAGLTMKSVGPRILNRFGFRSVLIVNGVLVACVFLSYSTIRATTPHWLIMCMLAGGGFFRALQNTCLASIAYADVEQAEMSRATTTSSIGQQVMQSVGVGSAAAMIHVFMSRSGVTHINTASVTPVFAVIGIVTLISLFWFVRLPANAGDNMNRRVRSVIPGPNRPAEAP